MYDMIQATAKNVSAKMYGTLYMAKLSQHAISMTDMFFLQIVDQTCLHHTIGVKE